MTAPLEVQRKTVDHLIILRLCGDVDLSNVATLEAALEQVCGDSSKAGRIVVDATGIEFLSVIGMTALAQAQTHCQHGGLDFAVVASQHAVLRPLQLTGLDRQLKIFASLAAATTAAEPAIPDAAQSSR